MADAALDDGDVLFEDGDVIFQGSMPAGEPMFIFRIGRRVTEFARDAVERNFEWQG